MNFKTKGGKWGYLNANEGQVKKLTNNYCGKNKNSDVKETEGGVTKSPPGSKQGEEKVGVKPEA